ncbi:helix-hairpin-helix domain-containing protein [Oceanobacillus halotolerans]|uniref:helix-hairpin-helix domain-containing protein n=1 Tax=Oceanobacillus halotolerans TaxID=2663380 RepID=UPI001CF7C863|nr:helix-hairpin-helix domain-containing protein [Oceanobacillus halotolerans]
MSSIDLIINSHPDADHIGQLAEIVNNYEVGEVWLSGNESTSQTFQRALEAVLASDASYHEPRTGETFDIGPMQIDILHPGSISGKANEESIAAKFTYGDVSFVFTGDAEKSGEKQMMASGINVEADILQLGHHGSNTSSDPTFIDTVNPSIAIYSAGADNTYGHPHAEVISYLQDSGITVYGTDVHGTIVVETDGSEFSILTNKDGTISPESTGSSNNDSSSTQSNDGESSIDGCVNINEATVEELQEITHIGPARAEALVELRPFQSLDELTNINGIGPARIKDIKAEGIACIGG